MNVAFDESGNTGQNLLDVDSRVFALASCSFTAGQIAGAADIFAQVKAGELKFSKMIGRPRYEGLVLKFLGSPYVSADTVKLSVVHKRFMVITKYVDLILEPAARRVGVDFYRDGRQIATANLLNIVAATFLNPPIWDNFLASFVQMVWKRDIGSWTRFISAGESIHNSLQFKNPQFGEFFYPVLQLKGRYKNLVKECFSGNELDPIPPSYAQLSDAWGKQLGQPFEIIADESKVLTSYIPVLLKLSDPSLRRTNAGYGRRTMEFPLRVTAIRPLSSIASKEIQFADLLAGSVRHCLQSQNRANPETFEGRIATLIDSKKLVSDSLWPNDKVTPSELDTKADSGAASLVDYTSRILRNDPSVKG
jgi:hypothetical protein